MKTQGPAARALIDYVNKEGRSLPNALRLRLQDGTPSRSDLRWLDRVADVNGRDVLGAFIGVPLRDKSKVRHVQMLAAAAVREQGVLVTAWQGVRNLFGAP